MTSAATAPREERKVVTVLFADLVGFTSRAEQLDPEDVRAFLSPFYARLRTELERFGGTVEKFIGDAVMALFGAPVAHEDDPERAVRAALAIRDWAMEQENGLQLRIAVNTGEALVALTARTAAGEGLASGDVVNTTARLQAAAPVNGILVGERTYRATAEVVNYRAADAVRAKGKAEPVPVWEALEARSRVGVDVAASRQAPLVGRSHERSTLSDALARVRRDSSPQLVTVVGVPGMGKSRLVADLFSRVDDDSTDLVSWRQGRCLPYGEGVTYWALGEMVKAQAGILETDSAEQAERKLVESVMAVNALAAEGQWVARHLRPLVGLSSAGDGGPDRREEIFAAWRRYFEALAEQRPLVMVFEDLHWADENLLDFIEHLIDWASGVPLLLVCTARPELFERRAGWAGGSRNSTRLWLAPLSEIETASLISRLATRPVMDVRAQQTLLERAGGNPLYAEQFVRMVEERGATDDVPLPETVQGIIAARLDALSLEEKRVLQTAAVVGKVFWLGAVAHPAEVDSRAAELLLHALERKDFVRRARRSSVADEAEYSFLHVLVRDVAYAQIPRGRRADQHRLVAEWISSLGRIEDLAETLAHHYLSALDLWQATGQPVDAEFSNRALVGLREAGDRANSLSALPSAARYYSAALELAAPGSANRARLLFELGRVRAREGELDPALLTSACDAFLATGDRDSAAETEALIAEMVGERGDRDAAYEHLDRARELIEGRPASTTKAFVLSAISAFQMLAGNNAEALRVAREALAMADQFSLDYVRGRALGHIGAARLRLGDAEGFEDLEASLEIGLTANQPYRVGMAYANLAGGMWEVGQLRRSVGALESAVETASRFGLKTLLASCRADQVDHDYTLGRWDAALAGAEEYLEATESQSPQYSGSYFYTARAQIRLGRDDLAGARTDSNRAVELARMAKDPQILFPALASCAYVFSECGDTERAADLAGECVEYLDDEGRSGGVIVAAHLLAWTLVVVGEADVLTSALAGVDVPWARAAVAFANQDLEEAARICQDMGAVTEEARDRLWLAHRLMEGGHRSEAQAQLDQAQAFYRSVAATRYLRVCQGLLAKSA